MMRAAAILTVGLSLALSAMANAEPAAPTPQLKTLADVHRALSACWRWPPLREARSGMELTIRVSFKRNGDVFGSQITYQTPNVPDEERSIYFGALAAALARCAPLPFSESLGEAIAGRPLFIHIHDTRQQRKA
jgi:hypothetical protein